MAQHRGNLASLDCIQGLGRRRALPESFAQTLQVELRERQIEHQQSRRLSLPSGNERGGCGAVGLCRNGAPVIAEGFRQMLGARPIAAYHKDRPGV
jgi:hypothetical protein